MSPLAFEFALLRYLSIRNSFDYNLPDVEMQENSSFYPKNEKLQNLVFEIKFKHRIKMYFLRYICTLQIRKVLFAAKVYSGCL